MRNEEWAVWVLYLLHSRATHSPTSSLLSGCVPPVRILHFPFHLIAISSHFIPSHSVTISITITPSFPHRHHHHHHHHHHTPLPTTYHVFRTLSSLRSILRRNGKHPSTLSFHPSIDSLSKLTPVNTIYRDVHQPSSSLVRSSTLLVLCYKHHTSLM